MNCHLTKKPQKKTSILKTVPMETHLIVKMDIFSGVMHIFFREKYETFYYNNILLTCNK